jgi:hypothetical protein
MHESVLSVFSRIMLVIASSQSVLSFYPLTSITDGSETTEDQQLLDRDCSSGEYPPVMDSNTHLGYGQCYNHLGAYYYECPMMLVGPTPMPAQVAPSIMATMPCPSVALSSMEWNNSTFVPKPSEEQYCMMSYEV